MIRSLHISTETLRTLKRIGWVALLFAAAIVVISAVERKEASLVSELSVEIEPLPDGELLINGQDVRLAIERSFGYRLEGMPIGSIDILRLEQALEAEPFIIDADVYIGANNRLKVGIVQRQPILRIMDKNGLNYYLDANGIKMPLSKHFTAKVIVATGNLPPHEPEFLNRKRNTLKDAFLLTKMILEDEFLNALVEQIHLSNRGEITLVPKVGNHKIIFGTFGPAAKKLKRLKTFYKEALPYEGWNKYSEISLQYDGQVVCKKR
ncbi:MAG: cell division protein FtsQ [Phaeodactylibacter sp.]|nr:cell division protein FtsQ [Phaeodactylibacter sp.]